MYEILKTDTADECIRKIVLFIATRYGKDVALAKLNELEENIQILSTHPYMGSAPRYLVLKRQGFRVLILKKNLVFYKVNEQNKKIIIYAVVDQRQDYLNIIRGL